MSKARDIRRRDRYARQGTSRALRTAGLLLIALGLCVPVDPAVAGPAGESIAAGDVSVHRRGNKTKIWASDGAIIDWHQGFDIAPRETVRFFQPGAFAQVLNRDHSNNATMIGGRLSSNGTVMIANPYGVFVGKRARLNVGRLVAAAGDISNQDFFICNSRRS